VYVYMACAGSCHRAPCRNEHIFLCSVSARVLVAEARSMSFLVFLSVSIAVLCHLVSWQVGQVPWRILLSRGRSMTSSGGPVIGWSCGRVVLWSGGVCVFRVSIPCLSMS
jgi:hypothetical protein